MCVYVISQKSLVLIGETLEKKKKNLSYLSLKAMYSVHHVELCNGGGGGQQSSHKYNLLVQLCPHPPPGMPLVMGNCLDCFKANFESSSCPQTFVIVSGNKTLHIFWKSEEYLRLLDCLILNCDWFTKKGGGGGDSIIATF